MFLLCKYTHFISYNKVNPGGLLLPGVTIDSDQKILSVRQLYIEILAEEILSILIAAAIIFGFIAFLNIIVGIHAL